MNNRLSIKDEKTSLLLASKVFFRLHLLIQ